MPLNCLSRPRSAGTSGGGWVVGGKVVGVLFESKACPSLDWLGLCKR